jgi:multicomponent Na+:H+ antiporter subunit F
MMETVTAFILGVLMLSLVLAMVRLVRGPVLEDRVVALDLMTTVIVCITIVVAIRYRSPELIDVAVILAVIAFLGTVAFANYLERGERK